MLRAVLLDLGETLVHLPRPLEEVRRDSLEALYDHLKRRGLEADFNDFAETFLRVFDDTSVRASSYSIEIPMREIIAKALMKFKLKNLGAAFIQEALRAYYKPEIDAWQLFPDTIPVLVALRDAGFKMGLISNARSDWAVHAILEKYGLQRFLKVILTSAALRIRKPRPDIFLRALAALDVSPVQAVFVGDSLEADIEGARAAGIRSIHILHKQSEYVAILKPDATVSNLTEALNLITNWVSSSPKAIQATGSKSQ